MYVDKFPVTNADYAEYLTASGYVPRDSGHWLEQNFDFNSKDGETPRPKAGWEDKPVTYVSLEDAREYCGFQGKRLPHAYEWQYFAQGTDGRLYPWGNIDNANLTPAVNSNWTNPGPERVGQYPGGSSPFGIQDLVRSVWQYTSEFQDEHTRAVIVRGGSNYVPWRGTGHTAPGSVNPMTGENLTHPWGGSRWYFRPAERLDNYNKYFLMSGSYERAGTLGFRCVADAVDDCRTNGSLCLMQHANGKRGTSAISDSLKLFSAESGEALPTRAGELVFRGPENGFELWAPAADAKTTVHLHVGSLHGARGTLVATVAGEARIAQDIYPNVSEISLAYRGGPLRVRYTIKPETVCTSLPCLQSLELVCEAGLPMDHCVVDLSKAGTLDWAHWGSLRRSETDTAGRWFSETKRGGPALLRPELKNASDLDTWGGKAWPSDRVVYSWTGGSPTNHTQSARAGVTSAEGTFSLTVPAPQRSSAGRWKLSLYLGLFNYGAFGNSATLRISSPGRPSVERSVDHDNGNNNDWKNLAATIVFDRETTITWALGDCNPDNAKCGLVSFQAASLQECSEGIGGLTLHGATLEEVI